MSLRSLAGRFISYFVATIILVSSAAARPTVQAVLNSASFDRFVAPGSAIAIFGTELATSTAGADSVPLPRSLAGVTVTMDGIEAPLYYVSANQINALIPYEISPGKVFLVVTTPTAQSSAFRLDLVSAAPGIFSLDASGTGLPLLLDQEFQIRDTVTPGEWLILYVTGLGATDPPIVTGEGGASVEPLNRVVTVPDVYIGGQPAVVDFAGAAPGLVGVYQLNIVVPGQLSSDEILVIAAGNLSRAMAVPLTVPSPVIGSSVSAEESRPVEEFRRVQLVTVAEADIRVGVAPSLTIVGDSNVLPLITTEVNNGTLKIGTTRRYTLDNRSIRLQVTTPALDRVTLIGVGDISVNNISGERFGATIRGVGSVSGSGDVQSVDVLMQAVGSVSLFGLTAQEARVWCEGVGRVEVNAADFLFARVFGLGSVIYSGDPEQMDVEVVGLGSIRPQ